MKLMVPVAGMVFAAGSCCCCGSFFDDLKSEVMSEAGNFEAGEDFDINLDGDDADAPEAASGSASGSSSGASTGFPAFEDTCGRFTSMGITAPSGFKKLACADSGGSSSLVLTGSGDPETICKPYVSWVESQGYKVQFQGGMSGTQSIVAQGNGERMVVACTNSSGPTLITFSVSQG